MWRGKKDVAWHCTDCHEQSSHDIKCLLTERYNIDLRYKPGKELYFADTLLRAHLPTTGGDDKDLALYVHSATTNLPVSNRKLAVLCQETASNSTMIELAKIIQGWPNHKQKVLKQICECWTFRDELVVTDGLILKGETIVVPQALRKDILAQIHEGHLGIKRSKLRVRDLVVWPGMTKRIEDKVTNCSTCHELRSSNPREPMLSHKIPKCPWQIVATNLFLWNDVNYIVVVDYYSRYWEIASLCSTTSTAVIEKLKQIFFETRNTRRENQTIVRSIALLSS